MDSSRFDDLTKALATATSRRQALKTITATALGGLLGLGGIGTAFGKNKTCAQFCASVFGANTPAAGRCTSDAAHGKGLCYSCSSNANPSSICCTRNSSGFCSSYSPTLPCSCGANQTCQNGQCISTCPPFPACNATCPCPSGETCLGGSCCANANVCGSTCLAAPCDASQCQTCQGGSCVSTCTSEQVCQSGSCCLPTDATFSFNCGETCCDPAICCSGLGSNNGFVCICS